jgi:hypothetical protein
MQTENMNTKMTSIGTPTDVPSFPVGYYQLHPNRSLNWQMNRNYKLGQRSVPHCSLFSSGHAGCASDGRYGRSPCTSEPVL